MQTPDLSEALKATEGDVDLLRDVVEAFFEEYPILLEELGRAIRSSDCDSVQRASHTIKGTLRIFGDVPARRLARQLEEMGRIEVLGGAEKIYDSLKDSLSIFHDQLKTAVEAL